MHAQPDTIEQKLDEARRRLLDMSRRNRLLNYRAGGNRSLKIVEADPAAVYRLLMKGEKSRLEFLAAEEAGIKPDGDKPASGDAAEAGSSPDKTAPPPGKKTRPAAPGSRRSWRPAWRPRRSIVGCCFSTARPKARCKNRGATSCIWPWAWSAGRRRPKAASCRMRRWCWCRSIWCARGSAIATAWCCGIRRSRSIRRSARCAAANTVSLCPTRSTARPIWTSIFQSVENTIAKLPGWTVQKDVHLGLFTFAKLLMYLDLDPARWPEQSLASHPLVRGLCGLPVELPE